MTKNCRALLTKQALDLAFIYWPERGYLISKRSGKRVGFVQYCGREKPTHRAVSFSGGIYQEHIVIWIIKTGLYPSRQIDHKDLDPTNNKWKNLRLATNHQNHGNKRGRGSAAGLKGVHKNGRYTRKHRARITVNGKTIHLGYHDTAREAHEAYKRAAVQHFGEFARFG